MLTISNTYLYSLWTKKQEQFIASLQLQPLVVLLRPKRKDLEEPYFRKTFFSLVEQLNFIGVKHIEVAWSSEAEWISLMKELKTSFTSISLGAASVTNNIALKIVSEIKLDYAMSPIWSPELQIQAINTKQLLIPGVFSPTEIQQAKSFGCRLLKLFPASTLGIDYLNQLREPIGKLPFIIAAGGLTINDINIWLKAGHGAITLGKKLLVDNQINPQLQSWIEKHAQSANGFI